MSAKVFLLFLVGCGVSANEEKLVGSKRCTYGPSYWCKDYGKAVECDAVQHCRENVWKSKSNDMDPCTLCKLAITRLKNILDEATVQAQLLDFLKDVCDNAGLGPFTGKCKEMVTKYEPDIIKNLDKILADAEKVCAKIGMCKAQDQRVIFASLIRHANQRIQVKPFDVDGLTHSQKCLMCKSIKKDLDKIPNRTKRIEAPLLQQACNGKSVSEKKKCQWAVTQLVPVITSIMRMKFNEVCMNYNIGSCKMTSRVVQHNLISPRKLQDFGCDFCIYLMGEAEDILKNASLTEKQFEKMVLALCDEFKFMAFKCKQIVDRYLPLLYELLSELKPYQVCQEIMMCPATAADQLRRDPRCFLGASFWCANLKNAERCSALQYCKSNVWHAQIQ